MYGGVARLWRGWHLGQKIRASGQLIGQGGYPTGPPREIRCAAGAGPKTPPNARELRVFRDERAEKGRIVVDMVGLLAPARAPERWIFGRCVGHSIS